MAKPRAKPVAPARVETGSYRLTFSQGAAVIPLTDRGAFDHAAFWRWADDLAGRCRVFVSEYNAPANWVNIWQRNQLTNIDNKRGVAFKAQERLFVPESQLRRLL